MGGLLTGGPTASPRARLAAALGLVAIMVFGGGCATSARTQDPLAGTYFGSGSGAGLEQVQALAKRFGVLHPGVEFKLDDAGSETGIVLVIQNQIDFRYVSRDLAPDEVGKVTLTPLMGAGTAVAVNSANPVTGLTKEQIRDIFAGKSPTGGASAAKLDERSE